MSTSPAIRLLVVDDKVSIARMLARRLAKRGFETEFVTSGADALQILQKRRFDGVIADQMMPGMTGLDLIRTLREDVATADLPVVMVTAVTDTSTLAEALEAGAADYVTKPVDLDALVARLRARVPARGGDPGRSLQELSWIDEDFASRYQLTERIGSGGFGTVYAALHKQLQRPVALKILHPRHCADPEAVQRFRDEGIKACQLQHPNAVQVHDFGFTSNGRPYLVMELLRGHTLADVLSGEVAGKALPAAQVHSYLAPVCDALIAAHGIGLAHQDIKPDNIFIDTSADLPRVKVIDFGIAGALGDGRPEQANLGAGTPLYMAPERFQKAPPLPASDVYSVGVMLYAMLAGCHPLAAGDDSYEAMRALSERGQPMHLGAHRPDLPYGLVVTVMEALHREPQDRCSLRRLRVQLERFAAVQAQPVGDSPLTRAITNPDGGRTHRRQQLVTGQTLSIQPSGIGRSASTPETVAHAPSFSPPLRRGAIPDFIAQRSTPPAKVTPAPVGEG